MLRSMFTVNFPYGFMKISGNWVAFNREYKPLGFTDESAENLGFDKLVYETFDFSQYAEVYPVWDFLTDAIIKKVVDNVKTDIMFDENGEIIRFYLYNDATNPFNVSSWKHYKENLSHYFEKLELLFDSAFKHRRKIR